MKTAVFTNQKDLKRGWAPLEAYYTLQPTPAKHRT